MGSFHKGQLFQGKVTSSSILGILFEDNKRRKIAFTGRFQSTFNGKWYLLQFLYICLLLGNIN